MRLAFDFDLVSGSSALRIADGLLGPVAARQEHATQAPAGGTEIRRFFKIL
jgi:hypothetical protein